MNFKFICSSICVCLLSVSFSANSALSITTTSDATILSNAIIGSGLTIQNSNYSGGAASSGTFTGGLSAGIGMETGIILTSGTASDAVGPNISPSTGTTTGSGSDADLQSLVVDPVFDATSITIDFTSDSNNIFFNYVFASEEYNEFVNKGVNDVFGLFLDGVNISQVPGTSIPVSIDNVNLGVNSGFFNDNENATYNIEYDGFTNVFTASFFGLSAGTHSLKFAVGDVGDGIYDSAVFIQSGTFSGTTPPAVPVPAAIWLFGSGFIGLLGVARRRRFNS